MSIQERIPATQNGLNFAQSTQEQVTGLEQSKLEQRLYTITNRLISTLDVERCITLFMQAVAEDLEFDGYQYDLAKPEPAIILQQGRQSRNTCSYNLDMVDAKLGSITLYRGRRFLETELKYFEKLLCVLVYPLRNSIMYRKAQLLSQQDALTGLNNRAAFDREIKREISQAERYENDLTLAVLDIDHFKLINDSYGHAAGDAVLQAVADKMLELTRDADEMFRYGGEEFVMILSNIDTAAATGMAERLRTELKDLEVNHNGVDIRITVSIGIAGYQNLDTHQTLFERADSALYEAKAAGRNQVLIAD